MDNNPPQPAIALGVAAIDESHERLLTQFHELSKLQDEQIAAGLQVTIANLEADFRQEERWMEQLNFRELPAHRQHHARVLATFHKAQSAAMQGNIKMARTAIEYFPFWLEVHVSTMDAALAQAMKEAGIGDGA